jgi:hypothetical protein
MNFGARAIRRSVEAVHRAAYGEVVLRVDDVVA